MEEIKAPNKFKEKVYVFLAGSIEMGKAEDWQQKVCRELSEFENVVILNPRRDDWDTSWKQTIENKQFTEQVEWELEAQEKADYIIMNFCEDTIAPISLLELGLFINSGKMMVACPPKFHRKGNVDITCRRYNNCVAFDNLYSLISVFKEELRFALSENQENHSQQPEVIACQGGRETKEAHNFRVKPLETTAVSSLGKEELNLPADIK